MTTQKLSRAQKKDGIDIDLTDLKHNSTCITLSLPLQLCCDICMPIKMASGHMAKKSSVDKFDLSVINKFTKFVVNLSSVLSDRF